MQETLVDSWVGKFPWRIGYPRQYSWASLVAQRVKPAMRETRVQSLSWEDPLEKEMATHSSTLAWKIPWMEEPGRLQSMGLQRDSWASLVAQMVKNLPAIWETWVQSLGWKDPLEEDMATHSSILAQRTAMDWWATVHGVIKSQTRLSHSVTRSTAHHQVATFRWIQSASQTSSKQRAASCPSFSAGSGNEGVLPLG